MIARTSSLPQSLPVSLTLTLSLSLTLSLTLSLSLPRTLTLPCAGLSASAVGLRATPALCLCAFV